MIITISGHAGSGKSTVAKLLAKKLGFKHYSAGDLRRQLAQERGLTIEEFNTLGETDPSTDKLADERSTILAKTEDNFILDGRLGWKFIPQSFKIFLDVDPNVAAERSFKDHQAGKRPSEHPLSSVKEALAELKDRQASDTKRYKKLYNVTYDDPRHYDLVIDTSNNSIEQIVGQILDAIKKLKK